jgi:hypothetical protein
MRSVVVSEVVESRQPDFKVGEVVTGWIGWQQFAAVEPGAVIRRIAENDLPRSLSLGVHSWARASKRRARPASTSISTTPPAQSAIRLPSTRHPRARRHMWHRVDFVLGPVANRPAYRTSPTGEACSRSRLPNPRLRGPMGGVGRDPRRLDASWKASLRGGYSRRARVGSRRARRAVSRREQREAADTRPDLSSTHRVAQRFDDPTDIATPADE